MNPRAIQQAIVRMMFDPAFAAAVHGRRALPGLAEDERALLRGVDRRAFATDRFRRARAVQALVEEYPVSAAAIGLAAVDAFLSAPEFHACVAGRGAMALAFATWLKDQASGVGLIEGAMARLRRVAVADAPVPADALLCGPRFAALIVPAGTLDWYEATLAWLGAAPLRRLADHGPRPGLPRRGLTRRQGEEYLLLEARADGGMDLGTASEALVRLLRHAEQPRPRRALEAEAVTRGAAAHEAAEVIDDLLADGLLVTR